MASEVSVRILGCAMAAACAATGGAIASAPSFVVAALAPSRAAQPLSVAPAPPEPAPSAPTPGAGEGIPTDTLVRDPAALASWLAQHNQDLLAVAARVRQAEAGLAQSRLFINPSLSAQRTDTTGTTNPPGLTSSERSNYGAALSETVEIGKR